MLARSISLQSDRPEPVEVLSTPDAAKAAGISVPQFNYAVAHAGLASIRVSGRRFWTREHIEAVKAAREELAKRPGPSRKVKIARAS